MESRWSHRPLDILTAKKNYATILTRLSKLREAEKIGLEVLEKREDLLGPNHPETLKAKNNYADTLNESEKYSEAQRVY